MKKTVTILLLILTSTSIYSQSQTDLDFYFTANTNRIINYDVHSFNQQSNQQILVGTVSTDTWNHTKYLRRINTDGTLDNLFVPPEMIGRTLKIIVQPDDKIILGLDRLNNFDFMRLNQDGTIDQTFQNNLNYLSGRGGYRGVALQSDGKILVAGDFTTVSNTAINGLIRLNSNGLWDSSFSLQGSGLEGNYLDFRIIPLSNGKILVGGGLTGYNGSSYNGLVRLNSDGSLDTSFNIGSGFENSWVGAIAVQDDGKIIVGGGFNFFNGDNTKKKLVRLNQDGSIDNTFIPQLPTYQQSIVDINILSDNKILVTGYITDYILKLNEDGSQDTSFDVGTGFNNVTRSSYEQTDGQILVGGTFSKYQSFTTFGVARILGNSVLSTEGFNTNSLNIYPNPANEIINLDIDKSFNYNIYNLIGKLLVNGKSNQKSINVSNLSKGIYLLEIEASENKIYIQKFIKN